MLSNRLSQQRPVEFIESATDVKFDNPVVLPASLAGIGYRVRGRFIKLIPVRVRVKDPKKVSSNPRNDYLLRDPVGNCGDGQRRLHIPQTAI